VKPQAFAAEPLVKPNSIEERLYQQEISSKACKKNTLLVLPTALGKTVISALTAAHFLYNFSQMRVLVMAPTRPLVLQHREVFMSTLKLRDADVAVLTGKTPPERRREVWQSTARLVFATPQVVENDLEEGRVSLGNFSLLVFDECHRARKDYAYTYVASKYMEQSGWPTILGMTASPGAERDKIDELCRALFIEQIEFRSEEDVDVAPYFHQVQVGWRQVELPEAYVEIGKKFRGMLLRRLSWLSEHRLIHKKPGYFGRRDLLELGERLREILNKTEREARGPLYQAVVMQSSALTIYHALELLESQGAQTLKLFLDRVEGQSSAKRSYRNIVGDPEYERIKLLLNQCVDVEPPKVPILKDEVNAQLKGSPSSKILVFTQYRDTAAYVVSKLRSLGLSVERFVGQASRAEDLGLSQEDQARILDEFRGGGINVLVATSIAEEGLDIPTVDLVIFYEPIPSEIRYIQRKGRTGRRKLGRALILAAKNTVDMAYLHASGKKVERMRRLIKSLNQQLNPVMRLGSRPEPKPMSQREIDEAEREAEAPRQKNSLVEAEAKTWRSAEVDRAARKVWMKIMKMGAKEVMIEDLVKEFAAEGEVNPEVVRAAIDKLAGSGMIAKLGWDRVTAMASMVKDREGTGNNTYEVDVEKVYPGKAVAWINSRWRARITPQDFNGPPNLIKKNVRFRARGTLYHEGETLCFKVSEVLEVLT